MGTNYCDVAYFTNETKSHELILRIKAKAFDNEQYASQPI